MSYVDFTYYQATYLGNVITDSAAFERIAMRASVILDRITFDRAAPIVTANTDLATVDKIKMATCAIAEEFQKISDLEGNLGIASESVGAHSVSYIQSAASKTTAMAKYEIAAKDYLISTGLMYRGFYDGELGGVLTDAN